MTAPANPVDNGSCAAYVGRIERARAAAILGVDLTATPEQVRDAFRRRARELHPDRTGGGGDAMTQLYAARRALSARSGDGWEFGPSPMPGPVATGIVDDLGPDDVDDLPIGGWPLLRMFPVAVAIVALALTAVVFVAAVGYDWSVSP